MIELTAASDTTLRIATADWLRVLQEEYLAEFVKSGGSAVKVVSSSSEELRTTAEHIGSMATQEGYYFVHLDPGTLDAQDKKPDLHRIDRFFFAVLQGVDLKMWAAQQARQRLESRGIRVAPHRRLDDVEGIAADNERQPDDLLSRYERELATPLLRDLEMAVEFRAAIAALVRSQLVPEQMTPATEEVLLKWFAGQTMPGAATALKKMRIYDRITQSNARPMLQSFCHWLPMTGHQGLVVVLDFRPYEYKQLTKPQRVSSQLARLKAAVARGASRDELVALITEEESEQAVYYSDTAYAQMLSMLRRFIDEIDWFGRFLLVVLTTPDFYHGDSCRSYFNYDALQTRIGLEVRDARRANPAASLVHLGGFR